LGRKLSIKARGDRRLGRVKQMLIDMEYIKCTECNGDGDLEKVTWHPQGYERDIGYESSTIVTCDECGGDGRVPCET